jgi:hypothetical protein
LKTYGFADPPHGLKAPDRQTWALDRRFWPQSILNCFFKKWHFGHQNYPTGSMFKPGIPGFCWCSLYFFGESSKEYVFQTWIQSSVNGSWIITGWQSACFAISNPKNVVIPSPELPLLRAPTNNVAGSQVTHSRCHKCLNSRPFWTPSHWTQHTWAAQKETAASVWKSLGNKRFMFSLSLPTLKSLAQEVGKQRNYSNCYTHVNFAGNHSDPQPPYQLGQPGAKLPAGFLMFVASNHMLVGNVLRLSCGYGPWAKT